MDPMGLAGSSLCACAQPLSQMGAVPHGWWLRGLARTLLMLA